MDKSEWEKQRDEIDLSLKNAERVWALNHGLEDPSVFNSRDLGILRTEVVEQTRDQGIIGSDIQKAIDKTQGKPPSKARLFLARVLSNGFYSYLRLRKALGAPKDSFTITPSRGTRVADCMGLINPGGLVTVKEGDYTIPTRVDVKTDVALRGVGNATSLKADTDGMTVVETDSTKMCMIKDLQVDLNDKALVGVSVKDSWLTNVRAKMINFKANSKGVHVNLATDLTGCYFNHVHLWVPDGEAQPGGTKGIHTEQVGTATYEPNHNFFSGRIKELVYGVHIEHGGQQQCNNLDCSVCDWGFYIETIRNVLLNPYTESCDTHNVTVTKTGQVTIIGGQIAGADIEVQSDATETGQVVWLASEFIKLYGTYNAGASHTPPYVDFITTGEGTIKLKARGNIFDLSNAAGTSFIRFNSDGTIDGAGASTPGILLKDLKGFEDATLSGTARLVEVSVAGVPYYFKIYPTKT